VKAAVDADDLSPEWLSHALDVDVRAVICERVGTGQTAATYRLALDAPDGQSTVVAKVAGGDETARRRVANGYRAEVGFYTHLVDTLDVRAPRCWYAAITDDALQFTLLLEDLEPRVPGVQVDGCPVGRAEAAVRNLAGLHAPRWDDETLFELDFVRRPTAARAAFLGELAISATEVFVDRYGPQLPAADIDTLRASAVAVEAWVLARAEPFAVLHGDYRLDNLLFGSDDGDVVAVDWQTLVVGPPARDVAYFLGTSLAVKERRAAEKRLVGLYHAELVTRGVEGYPAERCFEDYRLGQVQGPMITTMGAAYATAERTERADAMFIAMASRSCAAIRDLASLDEL
jgi:aminoglycoside/choline kinase family phosphotransferase